MSIVIGQKLTNYIAQYIVESWRGFCTLSSTQQTFRRPLGDFQRVFRHCRKWHSFNSPLIHLPQCTAFAPQNFAWALFSIPLGTAVIPRRNEKQRQCRLNISRICTPAVGRYMNVFVSTLRQCKKSIRELKQWTFLRSWTSGRLRLVWIKCSVCGTKSED